MRMARKGAKDAKWIREFRFVLLSLAILDKRYLIILMVYLGSLFLLVY